ncbi:Asp-tRNA(Asn)/Glu-tRNA(Gln) amidotransferase subunit GatA [Nitrosomonas sp.]|uniref:Asp-tRNA(Asn)/Glu-tRNA(Gln) amidotransferase subunit GatA n=1 Tax=Nitrosomonas sp. TaxID=42353 RepID=UPI0025D6326A|nr:Asp-tRNA(Asn)/Glu-tRNA(Gln) amidotransferase subunit GatA [Nitrosomonas sp.]
MLNASLKQLSLLLSEKKISSAELAGEFLARIKALNPDLNAFITVDEEKSLKQAQAADKMIASGQFTALTGIPVAQKDMFCTKGWLTTCGSKMLSNFVSPYDAAVVNQLDRAGMVNLGKTNMDEFAMGSSNETSYYGPVKNPWDRQAVPGGSSGGSACAVAARLVPAATGSDTGGSIRQPAALCGISGIRPTYGLVSRYGMIALASSIDQAGPMAKSAEDLALLLNSMIGFDERDSTSLQREKENYTQDLEKSIDGLRIGLPREFFAEGISSDVSSAVETALAEYRKLGATFVEVSLPNSKHAVSVYCVLAAAEASSNLSRFDGIRYGYRTPHHTNLEDLYTKTRAEGFGDEVKRRILMGTHVLTHGCYETYYLQAQKLRRLITEDFIKAFEQCDVMMGPTSPTVAFNLGEKCADPTQMYLSDTYTCTVSLAGLPGMSIPIGFGNNKRPAGLQIIGNYFREALLLNTAHRYQQVTNWHELTPPGINL